jgi:predicted secreted Zn-dependent protease
MQLFSPLRAQPELNTEILYADSAPRLLKISSLFLIALLASLVGLNLLRGNTRLPAPATFGVSSLSVSTAGAGPNQQIVPTCNLGSYKLPDQLSTMGRLSGVYIQQDKPTSYAIYGLSTGEINQQMADCTPVVEDGQRFGANTGYALSSYYMYGSNDGHSCSITGAVITAHINQIFPTWRQSGAGTILISKWQAFSQNVRTHEQGHIKLDRDYAQKLYDDLMNLPAQDCTTIKQTADAVVQRDYNAVIQANQDYDAQTKHGTTQGAVL